MKQKSFALLLVFCVSIILSCAEDKNYLPYRDVYLELDLTFRDKELKDVLGYKTYINPGKDFINGKEIAGYGGVLVINTIMSGLCAFDLACPNEGMQSTRVKVDDDALYATCPECGRKYEIGESGSGQHTDSKLRLTQYLVIPQTKGINIVTNRN